MGLADNIGVSQEEAKDIYNKVMSAMPATSKYIELAQDFAKRYEYVETLQGSYRRLPKITTGTFGEKSQATRQVYNSIVQGSGPYITNNALILIHEFLLKNHLKSKLVNTVHDSIVLDIPEDEITVVAPKVQYIMEHLPLPFFKLSSKGYDVPERWDLGNGMMRFPMYAEMSWGKAYGAELDFDLEEANKFSSLSRYFDYCKQRGYIEDVYNAKSKGKEPEEVEAIMAECDTKVKALPIN